jgi:hypothetical protein
MAARPVLPLPAWLSPARLPTNHRKAFKTGTGEQSNIRALRSENPHQGGGEKAQGQQDQSLARVRLDKGLVGEDPEEDGGLEDQWNGGRYVMAFAA